MIPTLTLCSLDRFRGMVDAYNYIIREVNILTFIYLLDSPYGVLVTSHITFNSSLRYHNT